MDLIPRTMDLPQTHVFSYPYVFVTLWMSVHFNPSLQRTNRLAADRPSTYAIYTVKWLYVHALAVPILFPLALFQLCNLFNARLRLKKKKFKNCMKEHLGLVCRIVLAMSVTVSTFSFSSSVRRLSIACDEKSPVIKSR